MQYAVYSTGRELTSALVVRRPYDSYRDSSTMPPLEMEVLGRTTLRTHTSPHAAEADLNGSTMAKQEGFPRSRLHSRLLCKVAYNNRRPNACMPRGFTLHSPRVHGTAKHIALNTEPETRHITLILILI